MLQPFRGDVYMRLFFYFEVQGVRLNSLFVQLNGPCPIYWYAYTTGCLSDLEV